MLITAHQNQAELGGTSGDDGQYQDQQSMPIPIPPSPTLTNPDMILPWDGNERQHSTPSPPFNLPSLESLANMQSFHGGQYFGKDAHENGRADSSSAEIGVAISVPTRPEKRTFPRNMWLYEGHEPSRPLSEIGEEDLSPPPSRGSGRTIYAMAQRNGSSRSSSVDTRRSQREDDERSESRSSASSSTISAGSNPSKWNRRSQGADSYHHESNASGNQPLQQESGETDQYSAAGSRTDGSGSSMTSIEEEEESAGDETSSVILSSEAERILENAKRRLTLMEGNLTRARSSMRVTPSPSPSSSPSPVGGSQPIGSHQPGGLYRSISRTERKSSILRPRQMYSVSQDSGNNWHSRVQSETNLPSTLKSSPTDNEQRSMSRSLSAMGSTSMSGFGNDNDSFHYESSRAYLTHRASTSALQHTTLDSLNEEPTAAPTQNVSHSAPKGLGISTTPEIPKITTVEEFNSAYPSEGPPSRAQSQLQVRDLKDQVTDLKIKISTLKVKTQEDNLRRRSLQSLRTPSPFTAAEQWYTSSLEYRDGCNNLNANAGYGYSPRNSQASQEEGHDDHRDESDKSPMNAEGSSGEEDFQLEHSEQSDYEDQHSIIESHYEDAEEGDYDTDGSSASEIDREALNEILNEPLDDDLASVYEDFPPAPEAPETTRHEDREDAFDYEHFFLHSALGNYSRSKMRRASNTSAASVETTRPIPSGQSAKHSRTNSTDSVSTVATFATATEGAGAYDEEGEAEDEINNALYWDKRASKGLRASQYLQPSDIYGYSQSQQPVARYPSNDSPTRTGGYSDADIDTPRAARSRPNFSDDPNKAYMSAHRGSQILTPPCSSPREAAGSATPTSAFVSSLVAASSPNPNSTTRVSSSLNNDDLRLLEQLFESLGKVCTDLQAIIDSPDTDPKAARILRRRLDAARRVLDGQLDA